VLPLPGITITADFLQWHQPPELPSSFEHLQRFFESTNHQQVGVMIRQPVDFYSAVGASLLTEPAPIAIDVEKRRAHREVNAMCGTIINTESAFGVFALVRVNL
jgi:hypothetical protein